MDFGYFGIESMFQIVKHREDIRFTDVWQELLQHYGRPMLHTTEYPEGKAHGCQIRTRMGSTLLSNAHQPEVATPPVRIQPGFTQQVADNVYNATRELLEFVATDPEIYLMGYAMHWNCSTPQMLKGGEKHPAIVTAYVTPFSLFTLTPLSVGCNLRQIYERGRRFEFLADYIADEDQIRAFSLLYIGMVNNYLAKEAVLPYQIWTAAASTGTKYPNVVSGGRDGVVDICSIGCNDQSQVTQITAQEYLERYYDIFREDIAKMGTEEEVALLEDFVYGRRELEVDKNEKWERRGALKGTEKNPLFFRDSPELRLDRSRYTTERPLPNAYARFLGSLANQDYQGNIIQGVGLPFVVGSISWNDVILQEGGGQYTFEGINRMEELALFMEHDWQGKRPSIRQLDSVLDLLLMDKVEDTGTNEEKLAYLEEHSGVLGRIVNDVRKGHTSLFEIFEQHFGTT
jgi:hypothetical protein